ncbi:hypothetical protein RJT34_07705 [Clitoria ternatea]|uniref:Uncharacterized protein n=1 Tax=Clitoria ternatea TaxID=43366 RepID=A0AAN9K3L8_CLITE
MVIDGSGGGGVIGLHKIETKLEGKGNGKKEERSKGRLTRVRGLSMVPGKHKDRERKELEMSENKRAVLDLGIMSLAMETYILPNSCPTCHMDCILVTTIMMSIATLKSSATEIVTCY